MNIEFYSFKFMGVYNERNEFKMNYCVLIYHYFNDNKITDMLEIRWPTVPE